jgi:hypothetical protein
LACQDKLFLNKPVDMKWWAYSWLYSSSILPFSVCPEPSMPSKHPSTVHVFLLKRLLIITRVSVALFFMIFTKLDEHSLSDTSRNCVEPNTSLQIKGSKD